MRDLAAIVLAGFILATIGLVYATKGIPVMCGDKLCHAIKIRGN